MSVTLSGGGFQRLRAHLYGSLLYYLQIAQKPEEPDTLQTGTAQKYRSAESAEVSCLGFFQIKCGDFL